MDNGDIGYAISRKPGERFIRMSVRGVWDEGMTRAARDDLQKWVVEQAQRSEPVRGILVDATQSLVQTQLVAQEILKSRQAVPMLTAVVSPHSALVGFQLKRVGTAGARYGVFYDEQSALDWLNTELDKPESGGDA